ncbi:hypothetical protein Tco_0409774 [Tanacetum coccineum]
MGDTIAQTRFESVSKQSNDSLLARGNTLRSDEERLKLDELMAMYHFTKPDEEITLVSVHDVNVSAGEEVFVAEQNVVEEVVEVINTAKLIVDVAQVSAAGDIVSIVGVATTFSDATTTTATIKTVDDIILAQALEEIKSTKPKKKRVVIQELSESTTKIFLQLSSQQSQERLDEETALNLQAGFDEEEKLAREKAKKEEVNIALIETWDDIQAKIDVDHELAERMQA